MQPAGADVLHRAVHLVGDVRQGRDAVGRELQSHPLRGQQFGVLLGQGVLRLGQDAQEVLALQVGQLDPDREAALQLGDQVARLGEVERARRDEQDVVGLDHTELRVDRRAFYERQQVALNALARNFGGCGLAGRPPRVATLQRTHAPWTASELAR